MAWWLRPGQYEYEGLEQQTDLNVWKCIFQKLDGSLCQAIRVEGLLCSLSLQVLRCLQKRKPGQDHAVPDISSYASKSRRCKSRQFLRQ